MDFKQLEAYVKVCELQSFSKAAEAIFLSQPSVSAYVSSLEKEFDITLINRSTKDVSPTTAGKTFYEYAKSMLAMKDKSILSLKRLTNCTEGDVEIMASSVPAQYILPDLLAEFHTLYPNVLFHVNQTDTAQVIKGISEQRGEIGFTGAKTDSAKCVFEHIMSDELVVIAPPSDARKYRNPADLFYNSHFIMREEGSGTRMIYEEFFTAAGIKKDSLTVSAYLNNTQSIINAVAGGLGFSIVSKLAAKQYLAQNIVSRIELEMPLPERRFYLVLKKNCAIMPASDFFLKFVRSYFEKLNARTS